MVCLTSAHKSVRFLASVALFAGLCGHAAAQPSLRSASLETVVQSALRYDDGDISMFRVALLPEAKWKLARHWQADIRLRFEAAAADTGLGSTGTFSPLSKPFIRDEHVQGDVDQAILRYRKRRTNISFGKQTVAWGVLDGLQITDRFDAVRRREFIFTDVRPERLARWGARVRTQLAGWRIDAAAMLDPSVNQLALQGDAFEVLAPRLRGGLAANAPVPALSASDRDTLARNGTYGLRLGKSFGQSDLSVLVITGPETDPVFRLDGQNVVLEYPNRTLIGATFQQQSGSIVWRLEGAYGPDQPVNTLSAAPLSQTSRERILLGAGLDWRGSDGLFVNAQLGWDHVTGGTETLVRPRSDVISTVRIQKPFQQETWLVRAEVIASLTDGDGVVRPAIDYTVSDALKVSVGSDIIFGTREGLFGQFRDESRLWLRISHTL